MTLEHFCEELVDNLKMFEQNMKKENAKPQSFPEWYNMFGRWLEVGTEMQQEYWGDDDDDGNVFLMNVNDLLPEDYVDPAIPFADHLMSVLFKETTKKYNLEIMDQGQCHDPKSFQVENTVDGSIFEITVVCKKKPSED